jgi:ABC-type cobalamin/Fe3+-siderophores transport system ATPase subunit
VERETVVKLTGVSVAFHGRLALNDISLSIKRGEFIGVAGPNGSGKSTLLRAINGLVSPSAGTVEVFGRTLKGKHVGGARRRTGYLPQSWDYDKAYPAVVRDVVMMGRWSVMGFFRRPSPDDRLRVEQIASLVGVGGLLDRPVGHLSGGEKKKMGIARAMAQEPEMLMLDEPTSDLDIAAQVEIGKIIRRVYFGTGLIVIFVTHFLSHLPSYCSRVILMKSGRVVADGPRERAFDEEVLSDLYGYPVKKVEVGDRMAVFPGTD